MKAGREELEEIFAKTTHKEIVPHLQLLEQAAVDKRSLTGSPQWDLFLQQLQAKINEAKEQLNGSKVQLDNPFISDDEVRIIRMQILILNERIGTLDSVMNLPKDIIEAGEKASLQLEIIGPEPETSSQDQ